MNKSRFLQMGYLAKSSRIFSMSKASNLRCLTLLNKLSDLPVLLISILYRCSLWQCSAQFYHQQRESYCCEGNHASLHISWMHYRGINKAFIQHKIYHILFTKIMAPDMQWHAKSYSLFNSFAIEETFKGQVLMLSVFKIAEQNTSMIYKIWWMQLETKPGGSILWSQSLNCNHSFLHFHYNYFLVWRYKNHQHRHNSALTGLTFLLGNRETKWSPLLIIINVVLKKRW